MNVTDLLSASPVENAISVSELNRQAKKLLEQGLARLWVEGEISNLARPASGHLYFSLKDESAQIRCAWFRQRQRGPSHNIKNGDQMLALGRVSLYEARGDYQLIVEQLEDAGEGELRRRFEELKKKLAAEGLFAESEKQAVPHLPKRIGIVTSPSGAAVRDVITVLKRRFPAIPVVIYPTAVQGEWAPAQITEALATAIQRAECDVLIVTRGGGSLEDLWSFNEEIVARSIAACPIPVVSAIGHEVDFTITDLVADLRAPTPTAAAELVVPDQADWQRQLDTKAARIADLGRRYLEDRFQTLDYLSRRLTQSSPATTLARQGDWLRNLQMVLAGVIRHDLSSRVHNLATVRSRLLQLSPALRVQQSIGKLGELQQRLNVSGAAVVASRQQRLMLAATALDSVSPLATLGRGYSIVSDTVSGKILTDASAVKVGTEIRAQLAQGALQATVSKTESDNSDV
jgi:exodeoxyribonuclease VII large subunit